MKSPARRNTQVKYGSPSNYQSKFMTDHDVKVYADGRTDRQTDEQRMRLQQGYKAGP